MLCKLVCASCTDSKVEELTRISFMSLYKSPASCLPSRCAGDYGQFTSNVVKCHFCDYMKWKYTDPTRTLKTTWKKILNIVGPQYYPAGVAYSRYQKQSGCRSSIATHNTRGTSIFHGIRKVGRVGSINEGAPPNGFNDKDRSTALKIDSDDAIQSQPRYLSDVLILSSALILQYFLFCKDSRVHGGCSKGSVVGLWPEALTDIASRHVMIYIFFFWGQIVTYMFMLYIVQHKFNQIFSSSPKIAQGHFPMKSFDSSSIESVILAHPQVLRTTVRTTEASRWRPRVPHGRSPLWLLQGYSQEL